MSKHSELEIFKLCERLAELLGDEKAKVDSNILETIADLNILLEQHPELFVGKEQSYNLIKKLIEQKIGEIGIRKDENISKIYHANEKRIKI
ncbi:hypothetical protein [Campylobacter lanienae]|uniref:hypothetical protein n=1 Tax=Campylobacter lanienae TaxID=75658 RepID=UPI0021C27487|nr:hypothetical protein [Campylobacter lanienae]